MPCYHPLKAYRFHRAPGARFNHKSGAPRLIFDESKIGGYLKLYGDSHDVVTLPCGKCAGCLLKHAAAWAIRCVHEQRYHERNCFLTLTYRTERLPPNSSLCKKDLQDFWKRLRIHLDRDEDYLTANAPKYGPFKPPEIKYFACGEYGEEKGRPHYHAVLFGWDFPDRQPVSNNPWASDPLYESPILNKIWGHGVCKIGELTQKSAAYTARYTMKKIYGEKAEEEYANQGKIPPFNLMSKGIGRRYFKEFRADIFPCDYVLDEETKTRLPVPRFYDKLLAELDKEAADNAKKERQLNSGKRNPEDQSPERLAIRETILKMRIKDSIKNRDIRPQND